MSVDILLSVCLSVCLSVSLSVSLFVSLLLIQLSHWHRSQLMLLMLTMRHQCSLQTATRSQCLRWVSSLKVKLLAIKSSQTVSNKVLRVSSLLSQGVETSNNPVVGTVSATDEDSSSNGEIRFAIAQGNIGSTCEYSAVVCMCFCQHLSSCTYLQMYSTLMPHLVKYMSLTHWTGKQHHSMLN